MSHKTLLFQANAREKLVRGATALTDAVRLTLTEAPEPKTEPVHAGGYPEG